MIREAAVSQKTVLNVGSGPSPSRLHQIFATANWAQLRLDANPDVKPDIVGSITDMSATVAAGSVDAVWSSHNIEHLHTHEVPGALREFYRVLSPTGFALITCPNLEAIARFILDGRVEDVIYQAPAGPITPLDMLFGHGASIARGNAYMAHHTAYTVDRLGALLVHAGFKEARVAAGNAHDLWALALMPGLREDVIERTLEPAVELRGLLEQKALVFSAD